MDGIQTRGHGTHRSCRCGHAHRTVFAGEGRLGSGLLTKLGWDITQGFAGSFFGMPVDIISLFHNAGMTVLLMVKV